MKKVIAVMIAMMLSAGCVYGEDLASLRTKAEHGEGSGVLQEGS